MQGIVPMINARLIRPIRNWSASALFAFIMCTACSQLERLDRMEEKSCTVTVKVLGHWLIQRFDGEALVASAQPRFVVALLLLDSKSTYSVPESDVRLPTHRVAFFAVDSLTKVFADTNIVGQEYRLSIRELEVGNSRRFILSVEGAVED